MVAPSPQASSPLLALNSSVSSADCCTPSPPAAESAGATPVLALLPPPLAMGSLGGGLAGAGELKKAGTLRPKELRITATSGMGSLLQAINVLGTPSASCSGPRIVVTICRNGTESGGVPLGGRYRPRIAVTAAGVEKAMSMAAPPLWQTPHAPSIGGSGAFRRPLSAAERLEAGMLARPGSADTAATRYGEGLSGGAQSPQLSRRFSAADSGEVPLQCGFSFAAAPLEQPPQPAPAAWSPTLRANGELRRRRASLSLPHLVPPPAACGRHWPAGLPPLLARNMHRHITMVARGWSRAALLTAGPGCCAGGVSKVRGVQSALMERLNYSVRGDASRLGCWTESDKEELLLMVAQLQPCGAADWEVVADKLGRWSKVACGVSRL